MCRRGKVERSRRPLSREKQLARYFYAEKSHASFHNCQRTCIFVVFLAAHSKSFAAEDCVRRGIACSPSQKMRTLVRTPLAGTNPK